LILVPAGHHITPETRMTRRNVVLASTLALALTTLGACRHKTPETAPVPAPQQASNDDALAKHRADSIAMARAAQLRADSIARANAGNADNERTRAELMTALTQKVYFDYDQDVLRDDARAVLDAKSAVMTANPNVTLVISGHTDERGTAEYNLALGQRRAAQVKRYLVAKGISETRLATQSMGDSQPATRGTDEAAYQLNRRAEFEAMNTSGALVRPRS
jgi:peptidoglycan-associated lipoprotein